MRATTLAAVLALTAMASGTAEAKYLFNTQFNSGRVPAIMKVADNDGQPLSEDDYRNGYTTDGWVGAMVTGGGYAAVSPSHTRLSEPQSNLLSCPAVTIVGERPMLRWKGRSLHPDMPEAYRVLIQEAGSDTPEVLFETDREADTWRSHAVDLTPWMNKEAVISFECVSVNKFLLAIDDIYIGDPEEAEYAGVSATPQFIGLDGDTTPVTGYVENMGMPLKGGRLVCLVGDEVVGTEELPADWLCGERFDYTFNLPVSLNTLSEYKIAIETSDSQRTDVLEGSVYASHYPRTLFVEEFTGLWCNNCPGGIVELQALQRRFGNQMIGVSVHANDVLTVTEYFEANRKYSVPWMQLNRMSSAEGSSASKLEGGYFMPTVARIHISSYDITDDNLVAEATVEWAEDLDNTSDRYRVGCVLTRDIITDEPVSEYTQTSSSFRVTAGEQYYYMQNKVASDLSPSHNVVLSSEYAHTGRPYGMATMIKAHQPEKVTLGIPKPVSLENFKSARLVAYIIDTNDGHILNACIQDLDKEPASICLPELDCNEDLTDCEAEYYTLDGIKVSSPSAGIYIVRRGPKVSKVIIK